MAVQPLVPPRGASSVLHISTPTVVKAAPGTIWRVVVTTAGSALGAVYNTADMDGTAANQVAVIPNMEGDYRIGWPCNLGILVDPGQGQTVLVSFT